MRPQGDKSENIPAYLAGTLSDPEKADLERELAASPELRAELALWKRMRMLARLDAWREQAGHVSPETIVEFVEGTTRNRASVERHLASCSECREDVETLRRISPMPAPTPVGPSLIDRLAGFFTIPRLGYALAIVAVVILLVNVIDNYLGSRTPEWRQLRAEADTYMEQGNDEAALELYQRALEVTQETGTSETAEVSEIFDSLATINRRSGNSAEARRLLEQSLALKQSAGLTDTWAGAWVLDQLGTIEKLAGDPLSSEAYYRRADAIREGLAGSNPDDPILQRYRRNVALIRLVPQIGFRGPETPPFPLVSLDEQTTHAEFLIVLRRNRDITARYLPTLTTPSRIALPLPDTLSVDPLHPSERTLRLTLSKRFFDEGKGTYRIGVRNLTGGDGAIEDVYFFQVR